ncbi:MAG: PLxRFG domain-containing protein [Gammaproteobacteria bacterium]|nr:PLxRFG domain-containing protein [Gammaproteobacteria bacterium]
MSESFGLDDEVVSGAAAGGSFDFGMDDAVVDGASAADRGFWNNTLRGTGERALTLGGNLMQALGNTIEGGEQYLTDLTGINPAIVEGPDGLEFTMRRDPAETDLGLNRSGELVGDVKLGYEPRYTWENLKANPSPGNLAGFVAEQGVQSVPDMAAVLMPHGLPAYIGSRTQEIAEARTENDGRTVENGQVSGADLAAAAPAAVASALLERVGAKGVTKVGGVSTVGGLGAAVGTAAAKEGGTEFLQENIEYAGESVGTERGFDPATGLDRGLAGAVAGSGFGGSVRAATGSAELAINKVKTPIPVNKPGGMSLDEALNDDIPTLTDAVRPGLPHIKDETLYGTPGGELIDGVEYQNLDLPKSNLEREVKTAQLSERARNPGGRGFYEQVVPGNLVSDAPQAAGAPVAPPQSNLLPAPVEAPVAPVVSAIDEVAHEAATSPLNELPEPSDAQKEAGNYKKGHIKLQGLDIAIENPAGSKRSGTAPDGTAWESEMASHYGYVKRTTGADGDQVDVFVGGNPESQKVFVVDQINQDGKFDEHKVMLGFDSREDADAGYHANYSEGWTGRGAITEMSMGQFKEWLKGGDTTKPLQYVKPSPAVDAGQLRGQLEALKKQALLSGWTPNMVQSRKKLSAQIYQLETGKAPVVEDDLLGDATEMVEPAPKTSQAAKWFGTRDKADVYIAKNKLGTTHEVVPVGKSRFEIHERTVKESLIVQPADDFEAKQTANVADKKAEPKAAAGKSKSKKADASGDKAGPAKPVTVKKLSEGITAFVFDPGAESKPEPKKATPAANTLVSDARAAELRKRLKDKLKNQLNSGIDPEIMAIGAELAVYHIERGARTFAAFAQNMAGDLGTTVQKLKPYLRSWYNGARDMMEDMGGDVTGMENPDAVRAQLATIDHWREPAQNDTSTTEDVQPGDDNGSEQADTADSGTGAEGPQPEQAPVDDGNREPEPVSGQPDGRVRGKRGGRTASRAEPDPAAESATTGADTGTERPVSGDRARRAGAGDRADRRNYRIQKGELKRTGSWKATAEQNVRIVELVKQINSEGRQATAEEKALLTKFTGWGASEIANGVFPNQHGQFKDGWRELGERLKAALTTEEYDQAKRTTQYAHYTSEPIIRSVYGALDRMGFAGGTILEPGMGIGLFNGLMPDAMAANSNYTGVEYDSITGNIAKLLYPESNIVVGDFTATKLPRDFFDAAIGNPPFGQIKIQSDPEYKKQGFLLHDYFFAKTIDRVKPGGLLVFVTSKGTMDKASDRARKYMAERADLVGAVRLPQTAFKDNAGTEVVTDVIFLRKRLSDQSPAGEAWAGLAEVKTAQGPAMINEYFAAHPEMVLGRHAKTGSMYRADEYTVEPIEGDIEELFARAVLNLPEAIYRPARGSKAEAAAVQKRDYDPKVKKEGGVYIADDGSLMQVDSGQGVPLVTRSGSSGKDLALKPREIEWLKGYVGVRDALKQAQYDQLNDGKWEKSLKALNKAYDDFVRAHGPILAHSVTERENEDGSVTVTRRFKNDSLLRIDAEGALAYALESINTDGTISKGPVLNGRTLNKPASRTITSTQDAMFVSLNDVGRFDLAHIAKLAGKSEADVIADLGNEVYEDPSSGWTTADEYLSGNVVRKLKEAESAARLNKQYARNVEALKNVQPRALAPQDITVQLGTAWVPATDVANFAAEAMGSAFKVAYSPVTGQWSVAGQSNGVSEWGTRDKSASDILEGVLNNRQLKVTYRDSEGKTHTDPEGTEKVNDIAKKLRAEFKRWIWSDTTRADRLAKFYNENFNNIAPRQFDGSHLTLPGVSSRFVVRPHQKRGVWRTIQIGDTYYAHAVGAGKTFTMIAAGMEERRLGLVNKPMYVVPNHMLAQFSKEFLELYPAANIMVADEQNFHTHNRRKFVAQAALNDPDAIVITHSAFARIGMSPEFSETFLKARIAEWQEAMEETDGNDRVTRKQIERRIEQLENRLKAILDGDKKDKVLAFEELGVDRLYVDEGHEYRKLDFPTNRGSIKGIDPSGSQKAMDLFMKVQYLRVKKPTRALVMASGTPVTNTMGELFTVQRYFQPAQLEEDGDASFDAWASHYGEVVDGLEQNAAGGYESVSRFAKFVNVPELMSRVRSFMDILTSAQLGDLVQRPDVEGGGRQVVVTPVPDGYKAYQKQLEDRIKAIRQRKGPPKPGQDIILSVIADGRFSAIDMRFVDSDLPSDPNSKLNRMLDDMIKVYHDTAENEYVTDGKVDPVTGGSLMLFTDIGLGEQSAASRGFDMKGWIEKRLIEGGVKPAHIAFMRDHKAHSKKERLFDDLRQGRKRILIGGKDMETGVNAQKRLAFLAHLDAPWFPASVEQREGRIIRQGNQNKQVAIKAYATKGSYDSTMWGMNARKARFIEQAMSGDSSMRSMDDVSEASAFEMAAALASGDERYLKLAGLKGDVERLGRLYSAHHRDQKNLRSSKHDSEAVIKRNTEIVAQLKAAIAKRTSIKAGEFAGVVGGEFFDSRDDFSNALASSFKQLAEAYTADERVLGKIGGFEIKYHGVELRGGNFVAEVSLDIPGDHDPLMTFPIDPAMSVSGLATRAANQVNGLDREISKREGFIAEHREKVEKINRRLGASFPEAAELTEKSEELAALEAELAAESKTQEGGELTEADRVPQAGGEDEAISFQSGGGDTGTPKATVERWIAPVVAAWGDLAPKVRVLQSMSEAPAKVLEAAGNVLESGEFKAVQLGNTVYLVADAMENRVAALKSLAHETRAHWGMQIKTDSEYQAAIERINWASRNNKYLRGLRDEVLSELKPAEQVDARVAEEVLARVAEDMETGKPVSEFVQRLVTRFFNAVRNALRRIGFAVPWSTTELKALVLDHDLLLRSSEQRKPPKEQGIDTPFFKPDGSTREAPEEIGKRFDEVLQKGADTALGRAKDWLASASVVDAGKRGALMALTLRQLADIGRRIMPQIGQYDNVVKRIQTERNVMAERAATIAEDWQKWGGKNRKVADKLHVLMHNATIEQVDPSEPFVSMREHLEARVEVIMDQLRTLSGEAMGSGSKLKRGDDGGRGAQMKRQLFDEMKSLRAQIKAEPDRRKAHARLKPQWDALTPQAKDMYVRVRDEYKARHEVFKRIMVARIMRAEMTEQARKEMLARLRYEFESQELTGPYFPLTRFGRYWLESADENGERVFLTFESEAEQARTAKNLEKNGFPVSIGHMLDNNREVSGASLGFINDLVRLVEDSDIVDTKAAGIMDDIYQLYLQNLPDRSMRKNFIHRQGVKGYTQNAIRAYAENMMKGAYQLSRLSHVDDLTELMDSMKKEAKLGDNQKARLYNEMVARHEWVMNPQHSPWAQSLTSLGFVYMLGASPAAAAINMAQVPIVALPVLGSKFGFAQAGKAITKAATQFSWVTGRVNPKRMSEGEQLAMQEWIDIGVVDQTRSHDLAGLAEGGGYKYSAGKEKAMRAISFLFHRAEQFNREVTALAAYRMGIEKGMPHGQAVKVAADLTWDAHFDYSNANRARFMQKDWQKVAFQFKNYSQHMTYYLARNLYQITKGATPKERREAFKQLGGTLGMTALAGGTSALPVLWAVYAALNAAIDDDDEPFDAETEFKVWLADMIGKDAASYVLHGAGGAGLSGRISLDGLWIRDPNRDLEGEDAWASYAKQAAGPVVGGIFVNGFKASTDFSNGEFWAGTEKIMPKVIKDGMKAIRFNSEGVTNSAGVEIVSREDLQLTGVLLQGMGLADSGAMEQYAENASIKTYETRIKTRRSQLMTRYYMAVNDGDAEELNEVMREVHRFNEKNWSARISPATLRRSMKARRRSARESENGIRLSRGLRYLREDIDYAE